MTLCRSWRLPPSAYAGWAARLVCRYPDKHVPPHRSRDGWTWWSDGEPLSPSPGEATMSDVDESHRWTAPLPIKADLMWPDGHHTYWSTHCRHGNHDACAATELAPGVPRAPAQCKTCAAPCACDCHRSAT